MSFIIERHFWPPFCFFGDVIDNKKTSVSLHGWDRPRGNQSCPLGPILGHEKWKFQGDVDHHLCCAFSLCLISLLYSQRVFSRYQIYISSYIFEIIRIMYEGNREIQLHILFIHYFLQEVVGTFGRASVHQRLKNQSLYHEILLLQKFNDISGKVLSQGKKSASNKRKRRRFLISI